MKKSIITLLFAASIFLCGGCITDTISHAKSTGIVVVGMRQSAKYGSCPGADVDANRMGQILSKYGTVNLLMNNQATKANVINALNAAAQKDLMIFYFSGHGGSDPIGDVSGESDGMNESICLYNTYMLDNEIWAIIQNAKGRVFCIFDCCHSETMYRSAGITFENLGLSTNELARSSVNMLCWSGCPDNSVSYGADDGGYFTNLIVGYYKKSLTYDQLWNKIDSNKSLKKYQDVKKTKIGHGFGGAVFK